MSQKFPQKQVILLDHDGLSNETLLELIRDQVGCNVTAFTSVEEANTYLNSGGKVDAFIGDSLLSEPEGMEFLRKLRGKMGKNGLIVMYTGGYNPEAQTLHTWRAEEGRLGFTGGVQNAAVTYAAALRPAGVDAIYSKPHYEHMLQALGNYFSGKGKPKEQTERAL